MAVVLTVEFLAGRYHACPWDRFVNEGAVEWPPSPWRLLRALVAASYKLPEPPPREVLLGLLESLAEDLPRYKLPPVTEAHTRHYMPIRAGKKMGSTKVFDSFLAMSTPPGAPPQELIVAWPELTLPRAQEALLEQLCPLLGYLGRAESWVRVRPGGAPPAAFDAVPTSEGAGVGLLAPLNREGLEAFKQGFTAAAGLGPRRRKRDPRPPADLLDVLSQEPAQLQTEGWGGVPGAREVSYTLRETRRRRAAPPRARELVQVVRYAISATVQPRLKEAISLGDRTRAALMSRSKTPDGAVPAVFSGRGADGRPLRDHRHLRVLSEPGSRGRVEVLTVLTTDPEGFTGRALAATETLTRLWARDSPELALVLLERGPLSTSSSPLLGTSRRWRSVTPFVPTGHPKRDRRGRPRVDPATGRWRMGPEDQLYRALARAGFPTPESVEPIRDGKAEVGWHWNSFQFGRRGGGCRGPLGGYGFVLHFPEPVSGPISLGYGAHFGLGTFRPDH